MRLAIIIGITLLLSGIILSEGSLVMAQEVTKVGTTAAKSLSIPVGARALAMGGAFVSVANDATAMYWNPGGIARLARKEIILMHSEWLADINFDYVGVVVPIGDFGSVGVNFTSMSMAEMEITTEDEPEGTGETFSAGTVVFGLAYARNLTDRFSIGFNVKYIVEHIWNCSATGLALDIGTLFTTPFRGIRLGVSISNFGQKMQIQGDDLLVQKDIDESIAGNVESVNAYLATDRFDLPLLLRIGLSTDLLNTETTRLTVAVDGVHPNDNTESLNMGCEYSFLRRRFFLRAGYKSLFGRDSEEQFTFGAGLRHHLSPGVELRVDYAYEEFVHLNDIHKFSLSLVF